MEAPAQGAQESYEVFGGSSEGGEDFGGGSDGSQGMGQSKSSRRRRRKRKGKAGDGASADGGGDDQSVEAGAPVPFVMEGESIARAAAPAVQNNGRRQQGGGSQAQGAAQQAGGQQGGGQQQGQPGQGQGGKRWKKKFRDRERRQAPRPENPGNDFRADSNGGGGQQNFGGQNFGGGGFKRKNKGGGGGGNGQRRERTFVGPMDHSYREANGNFSDSPPSTIQLHGSGFARKGGRHHGDSQPIDHNMPRAIPIPENAQTHIYFFIEDLFFTAKIQEMARKQGVKVAFIKNEKEALDALTSGEDRDKPALIVFDLNNANAKPLTLIPKLRTKLKKTSSIIGFLSHLQGDLKAKATEAGCDTVMPRAAFSQNLPNLLRRYSAEDGEEVNYNQ